MLRGAGRFAGLVGAVVLVACATGYPAGMAGTATPAFNGVRDSDGTTSLDEDELHADGRNLLDVLQQRLPNMTVSQDGDPWDCPGRHGCHRPFIAFPGTSSYLCGRLQLRL